MKIDELAAKMDQQFAGINQQLGEVNQRSAGVDQQLATIAQRFDSLEKKIDDGFTASKVRDEELRDLTKFGLEAREILRDEMHRRFDDADRKNDEQISLLKDAIHHRASRK